MLLLQRVLLLCLVLSALAVIVHTPVPDTIASGNAWPQASDVTEPPPTPENLTLEVIPATTVINASWDKVVDATSYVVQWRHRKAEFETEHITTVTQNATTFDVAEQGQWIIRVDACNDNGCGQGATATTRVILNYIGHLAVRVWFDPKTDEEGNIDQTQAIRMHFDWDELPGPYVIKYRRAGHSQWTESELLTETGFTLDEEKFRALQGDGHPIARVYFNCDENGNHCALLGRYPAIDLQDPGPGGHYTGIEFLTKYDDRPPSDGATGSSDQTPATPMDADPVTRIMRPTSDFTVTEEYVTEDDATYRCISRAAESPWERGIYGTASDAIKLCEAAVVTDIYVLDPEAQFPDQARCGKREPQNDEERETFGDQVTVCNAPHPRETTEGGASGQSHSGFHRVDREYLSRGVERIARPGDGIDYSLTRKITRRYYNQRWTHYTWITGHWCYDYQNRVTRAYTIASQSGADRPEFLRSVISSMKFCGWQWRRSPSDPYEILWEYQPRGTTAKRDRLDWQYATRIQPWYGNYGLEFFGAPVNDCTVYYFDSPAGIKADWHGRYRRW